MEFERNETFRCVRPSYTEPFVLKPLEIPTLPVIKRIKKEEPSVSHQYPTRSVMDVIRQRQATRSTVSAWSSQDLYEEYKSRSGRDELLETMQGYVDGVTRDPKGKTKISSSRESMLRKLAEFALCPDYMTKRVEDCPSRRHEELKPKRESEVKENVNHSVTLNPSLTPVICHDQKETVKGASKGTEDALNKCTVSAAALRVSVAPVSTPACKLTAPHDGAHSLTMIRETRGGQIVALDTKTHLPDIGALNEKAEKLVKHQAYRQGPASIIDIDDILDDKCSMTSLPELKPAICKDQKVKVEGASKGTEDSKDKPSTVSAAAFSTSVAPVTIPARKVNAHSLIMVEAPGGQNVFVKNKTRLPDISAPNEKAEKLVKHQARKQTPVPSVEHEDVSGDGCSMTTMPFSSSSSKISDRAANFDALTVSEVLQRENCEQSPITKLFIEAWEQVTGDVEEPEKEEKNITESYTLAGTKKTKKPKETRKKKKPVTDVFTQTENENTEEPEGTRKKKKPVRDSFTQTENEEAEELGGTRTKKKPVKDSFTQTEKRTRKKPVTESFTQAGNKKTEELAGKNKKKNPVTEFFTQARNKKRVEVKETGKGKKIRKWWKR